MAEEVELCVEIGANNDPLEAWVEKADINQLCRACANTHENMIPIFEGDGLEHDLQAKIDKHFPINISKDDGLPHQMCFQCASTLVAWHDMYTGCIDAEKKLKNLLKKSEDGGQVKEEGFQSSIVTCDDLASGKTKSQRKIGSEMEVDDDYDDDDDDDRGDDEIETEEVVLHKLDAKKKENTVELGGKGTTIRDQAKVVSKESIEVRPTTSIMQRIGRLIASAESSDKSTVEKKDRGIINRRGEKRVRDQCEVCSKCFTTRNALSEHRRIHTGERPYVCEECGKAFRTSATLYTHTKSHRDVRPYVCEACKKGFKCNQQLQRHISIHTGERAFVCDVCGKDFRRKNDLTSHKSIHNETNPYYCGICGREFRSNASLKRHLPLHDDTKAYTCPICSATFHHRRYLGNHLRLKHKMTLTEVLKTGTNIETLVAEAISTELLF